MGIEDREGKAREEASRASRAEALLKNELLQEAISATRESLIDTLVKSPIADDDGRRDARIGILMLDLVIDKIENHVRTGQRARIELKEIERLKKGRRNG